VRAAVAAAALLALAQAQHPPPFTSGVSLVTVDVTVVDNDGRPVPDLTPAEFEITLNNHAQPIRGFSYLRTAQEAMAGAVGPSFDAAPVSPAAKAATGVGRVFILLVDDLSFTPLAGKDLFTAAQRFVSALPATDLIGLATTNGTMAVNPTADRAPIQAALKKVTGTFQDPRGQPSGPAEGKNASPDQQLGLAQALDVDRGDASALKLAIVNECFAGDSQAFGTQSLEQLLASNTCARQLQLTAMRVAAQLKATVQRQAQAYESVIRAMRAATGIRHLVVLTDGVALAQDVAMMTPVARSAAEAGVELSVMMATPDISLSDGGRRPTPTNQARTVDTGAPQRRREDNELLLNGARTAADMAGGAFYLVTGDPDRFFDRVTQSASGLYRIAVEAPADTMPGRDYTLSARVITRPDVTARANRHAVVAAPGTAGTSPNGASSARAAATALVPPEEQVRRAIASGRALSGLDMTLDPTVRRGVDAAHVAIDVVITIAGTARAPVSTMFGLVDASGAIRTSDKILNEPDAGSFRLVFSLPVARGAYKLRFAAADASGAVGSIETPLDATLAVMGPLQASGLAIASLPGGGRTILAALELYPDAGGPAPDVLVKMALVSSGSEPVVERVIVPESVDGVLRAEAEFALDRLPAGAYNLRAVVLSGVTVLGTLTRPVK
jgi:VWFA-related protein